MCSTRFGGHHQMSVPGVYLPRLPQIATPGYSWYTPPLLLRKELGSEILPQPEMTWDHWDQRYLLPQTDRHLWKHYLLATSLADGNNQLQRVPPMTIYATRL